LFKNILERLLVSHILFILLSLIWVFIGCSSRKLTPDEQLQINDLYNQSRSASPQEQRLIDCKIKSIESSHRGGGVIRSDKDKTEWTSSDVDSECIVEQEKGQKTPIDTQDQQKTNNLIDKNLKDALDKVGK